MRASTVAIAAIAALLLMPALVRAADNEGTDRISFSGDFRLRYESIDEDFAAERKRMRFRGRFGFLATVSDKVNIVMRLATGGDNPVSTNQSFDDGFSSKDIRLDLAYVDWKISDELRFYGGKMKNPLFRAGSVALIWDSDLTPEGLAVKYSSGRLFATVGGFSVEERSSGDDSLLWVAQAGVHFALGRERQLSMGAGYFAYTDTVGNPAFHTGRAKGNTLDSSDFYVHEYQNMEFFTQLDTMLARWPLTLFAHIARNNEVGGEDLAVAYGVKFGSAKDKGASQFSWIYQDIEADSVIGTFNDSDFGGGGTDSTGHLIKAKYGLSKKMFIAGTIFVNQVEGFQGIEHDYNRIQLDLEFKFD